jgi:hypothetical protein
MVRSQFVMAVLLLLLLLLQAAALGGAVTGEFLR